MTGKCLCKSRILGSQPRDKSAMLVVDTIKLFSKNFHENGFSSQGTEMVLSLTTNIAAVTSPAI